MGELTDPARELAQTLELFNGTPHENALSAIGAVFGFDGWSLEVVTLFEEMKKRFAMIAPEVDGHGTAQTHISNMHEQNVN